VKLDYGKGQERHVEGNAMEDAKSNRGLQLRPITALRESSPAAAKAAGDNRRLPLSVICHLSFVILNSLFQAENG